MVSLKHRPKRNGEGPRDSSNSSFTERFPSELNRVEWEARANKRFADAFPGNWSETQLCTLIAATRVYFYTQRCRQRCFLLRKHRSSAATAQWVAYIRDSSHWETDSTTGSFIPQFVLPFLFSEVFCVSVFLYLFRKDSVHFCSL